MAISSGSTVLQSDIQYIYNSFNNVNNYYNFGAISAPGQNTTIYASNINTLVNRLNQFRGNSVIANGAVNGGLGSWPSVGSVSAGNPIYASTGSGLNSAARIAAAMRCYKSAQSNGTNQNGCSETTLYHGHHDYHRGKTYVACYVCGESAYGNVAHSNGRYTDIANSRN